MNKKQHQFLNENRVLRNSNELFYCRPYIVLLFYCRAILTLHEKYNTLKINGQTIEYDIKVHALKDTS